VLGESNFWILTPAALAYWNSTGPTPSTNNQYTPLTDFVKITMPAFTDVGCYWSRNCTDPNNYFLDCIFDHVEQTARRAIDDAAVPESFSDKRDVHHLAARTIDQDLQFKAAGAFFQMRNAAGLKNAGLFISGQMVTVSQNDADACDGLKGQLRQHQPLSHPHRFSLPPPTAQLTTPSSKCSLQGPSTPK
jgi:hypothetical protein